MAVNPQIAPLHLPIPRVGSLLAWLIDVGVSSDRLGTLFGTTAVNVRAAALRARRARAFSFLPSQPLDQPQSEREKVELGIRGKDEVLATTLRDRRLLELHDRLLDAVARHRRDYTFDAGIRELKAILPFLGCPGDARLIALSAEIHHHLGWFHTHLGHSTSALSETLLAMELWRASYNELEGKSKLRRGVASGFVESALVASHTHLLAQRPKAALTVLDLAEAAVQSISQPLGSDFFRQRGVATFQLREDEESKRQFESAYTAMLERGEAKTPASAPMTSYRHSYVLGSVPNWEGMMDIRTLAERWFGRHSLEFSMITNWTAAAGLLSDSPRLHQSAHDLLLGNVAVGPEFGHQATVRALLTIADELRLYPALRRRFIRRALYENTSRSL